MDRSDIDYLRFLLLGVFLIAFIASAFMDTYAPVSLAVAAIVGAVYLHVSIAEILKASRKHPPHLCSKCNYNLRGTIEAGKTNCPECGEPIAAE